MEKIRIGIIGMGRMGLTHYSIINTHPSVEVTAIADTIRKTLSMTTRCQGTHQQDSRQKTTYLHISLI